MAEFGSSGTTLKDLPDKSHAHSPLTTPFPEYSVNHRSVASIAGVLSLAVIAYACADRVNSPIIKPPRFGASASFQRSLGDPLSPGNLHNAQLKEVFARMTLAREAKGGRKLTKADVCAIAGGVLVSTRGSEPVAQFDARNERLLGAKKCAPKDWRRQVAGVPVVSSFQAAAATPVVKGSRAFRDEVDDRVYYWFTTPSLWEFTDVVPLDTVIAQLDRLEDDIEGVVNNSTSYSGFEAGVTSVIGNYSSPDEGIAEMLGNVAALAVSSAQYWEENAEEWIAALCEGEYDESRTERPLSSARPIEDECEEDPLAAPISGPRAHRDVDALDVITTFVWADVMSNVKSVKDMLSAAVSLAAGAYAVAENAMQNQLEQAAIKQLGKNALLAAEASKGRPLTAAETVVLGSEIAGKLLAKACLVWTVGITAYDSATAVLNM